MGNSDSLDEHYDGSNTLRVKFKHLRMLVDMIDEAGSDMETHSPSKSSVHSPSGSELDQDGSIETQGNDDQSKKQR